MKVKCETCDKEFTITPSRSKNKHHTCSKACLGKLSSKIHSKKVKTECVECGKIIFYKQSHFKIIAYPTCSRLCLAKIKSKNNMGLGNPKSLDLSGTDLFFWNKALDCKSRAKAKGLPFDLDHIFLRDLYGKQDGKCFYTKIPMALKSNPNRIGTSASFDVLSIDRQDSSKGYLKDNVVLTINCINMFKAHHDMADIRMVMKAIMLMEQESCLLKVKPLYGDSKLPFSCDPLNAGLDVFTHRYEDCGSYIKVFSGIAIQPSSGYYFFLSPRSSIYKRGLTLYNNLGIIDQNYTGEIIGIFFKTTDYKGIEIGDSLMQLVPQNVISVQCEWSEELQKTERGNGGFGSTDNKKEIL